jgi:hypothetical protein
VGGARGTTVQHREGLGWLTARASARADHGRRWREAWLSFLPPWT